MNLTEEILALLRTQFPGVREDGLQQLAASLSLQVATKEEAAEIVGKIAADKVQHAPLDEHLSEHIHGAKAESLCHLRERER